MASSLEKLTENLYDKEDKYKHFQFMKSVYPEHYELLCRKGFYPYEWVDDISKLDHTGLPPIEAFDNKLTQSKASPENYEHAKNVYNKLNCSSFRDYHLTYLKCDVFIIS